MDKTLSLQLIDDKIAECKDIIRKMRNNEGDKWSRNTVSTQTHLRTKEIKTLKLIKDLITQIKSSELKICSDDFESLTCLSKDKVGSIIVREGDSIMDLMFNKYKGVKDISNKIEKACEKLGLVIDTSKGIIVRI